MKWKMNILCSILFFYSFNIIAQILDKNGNIYDTVKIGNQIWLSSNLNVSCFRNGDTIKELKTIDEWENAKEPGWCYYNNDPKNGISCGKIYNQYAISDKRGLAPEGFHISTISDWEILLQFLQSEITKVQVEIKEKEGQGINVDELKSNLYSLYNNPNYDARFKLLSNELLIKELEGNTNVLKKYSASGFNCNYCLNRDYYGLFDTRKNETISATFQTIDPLNLDKVDLCVYIGFNYKYFGYSTCGYLRCVKDNKLVIKDLIYLNLEINYH